MNAELISIIASVSTGIAYKSFFANSWRSQSPDAVSITGMSHILSILNSYDFSRLPDIVVRRSRNSSYWDTALVADVIDGTMISAMYSWGAPFSFFYQFTLDDAIIYLDSNGIVVKAPRNSFDDQGYFKEPPIILSEEFSDFTPTNLVGRFLSSVVTGKELCTQSLSSSIEIGLQCSTKYSIVNNSSTN